jgi:oligoribonuclease (3'-5' exoribonuclease)
MTQILCPICEWPLVSDARYSVLSPKALEAADPQGRCLRCNWTGRFSAGLKEPRIPDPVPNLTYVSVDIETTGLNPDGCQILEIGAVYDDWTRPLADLPSFHCYMYYEEIIGQPFALALNAEILRTIANRHDNIKDRFLNEYEVATAFAAWLTKCGWDLSQSSITPAGKNFASFDRQFLKKLNHFEEEVHLHHRTLDPAMLFWLPCDTILPDSKTCYERAGLPGIVAHTALEDAKAVAWLLRVGFKRLRPQWK